MARQITSDKNYMKRHPTSGHTTMKGPVDEKQFGAFYTRVYTINHDIGSEDGRIPMFRAFFEPFRDGRIFEAIQDGADGLSDPVNTYGGTLIAPVLLCDVNETELNMKLSFIDQSLQNLDFPIYWVLYTDYGVV